MANKHENCFKRKKNKLKKIIAEGNLIEYIRLWFGSHNFTRLRVQHQTKTKFMERSNFNGIYKHTLNYFSISTASLRYVSLWGWNMVLLSLENMLSSIQIHTLWPSSWLLPWWQFFFILISFSIFWRVANVIKMEEKRLPFICCCYYPSHFSNMEVSHICVMLVRLKCCCMQIITE